MAIQILKNDGVSHQPHHDLESIYWLLVWMILRHTKHTHSDGQLACSNLFDPTGITTKQGWSALPTPLDTKSQLFRLAQGLRRAVLLQNLAPRIEDDPFDDSPGPVFITYEAFRRVFEAALAEEWPTDDAALPFKVPSAYPTNNQSQPGSLVKEVALRQATRGSVQASGSLASAQGSGSLKRSREGDDDPFTAAPASAQEPSRRSKKQK